MELIVRNPALPNRAGKARIEFDPGRNSLPQRNGEHIVLPLRKEAEFFPLKKGEQFVFHITLADQWDQAVYFGGTDEEPFLVRLQPTILSRIGQHDGEKDFFDALVPAEVRNVERLLSTKHKRQGDIFATRVPFSWEVLRAMQALSKKTSVAEVEPCREEIQVFGTRHKLTGLVLDVPLPGMHTVSVVEGVLEAPDHAPLVLRHPHVLSQTAHLFDPGRAD